MRRTLIRAVLLVLIGAAAGLCVNAWSPRRIPYIAPPKPALRPEEIISLSDARQHWEAGTAFFADARAPSDFVAGHIGHALSLPAEAFDKFIAPFESMVATDTLVVVYCDGEVCDLSHETALALKERGFASVRILPNGWTTWKRAGLPSETGAGP